MPLLDQPPWPASPEFARAPRINALQGPAQYLFTGEDALQIDSFDSAAGVTLTIAGAMLGTDLQLLPFSFTVTPTTNRVVTTVRVGVDSGWLEHIRIIVTAGAPLLGQTFVFVRICRGTLANALTLGTIASGYVTANTDLYWPGGTTQLPLDGEGWAQAVTIGNPAAGTDWSQTVPTNARWELVAASALLTTSAVVANRQPRLIADDGATPVFEAASPVAITAGLAIRESWGAGAGGPVSADILTGGAVSSGLPNDLYLPAGFRVRSATGAIDVGDQWSAIRLYVREWIEGV